MYIASYICFIDTLNSLKNSNDNWKKQYLLLNKFNQGVINQLLTLDFVLAPFDLFYKDAVVNYVASKIFNQYFANSLDKQKVRLNNDCIVPKYF